MNTLSKFIKFLIVSILFFSYSYFVNAQVAIPQQNLAVNGDFMSRDPQLRPLD